jgi:hypothetical protein
VLLAALGAWTLAVAAANRPAARARLRASIRDVLARKLPGAEVGDSLSIDPLFRVSFGPLTIRAERKGAPPLLRAERVRVRARLGSLLTGRAEPASVRLYGVRLAPGPRLDELSAFAERLRPRPDPAPSIGEPIRAQPRDWPAIHLRDAVVVLREGGRDLELGPLDVSVLRDRARDSDDLELTVSHRRGGRAWAQLHRGGGEFRLRASAVELRPASLPTALTDGSVRWGDGAISADLTLSGKTDGAASGRLRARLDRAWFTGERLAPEPVGPIGVDLEGALEGDVAQRTVAFREGALRLLGAVEVRLEAEGRLGPGLPFAVTLDAPAIDYRRLADALPPPLRPPQDAPSPPGAFSFQFAVSGPLREPAAWQVEAALDLAKLRETARQGPPVALRAPFTWHPEVERGEGPALRIGPENPAFVPLEGLPEHVVRAVTSSEDAGFFAHAGFDFGELRNAFAQGTEAGRVVRGASTITQQLAKNLYLSREKTLARKAREAMVAVALEASVPKGRLLEIYLNLAEWGPGLWGLGPAAQHYFGKAPGDLTVREAAFLASIIPNPVRFHGYYTRGELDEAWNERLRVILLHMAEAGVLSEEQLLEALDAPLRFAQRTAAADSATGPALPQEPLEALPGDGQGPGEQDHQRDAEDGPVEREPLPQ